MANTDRTSWASSVRTTTGEHDLSDLISVNEAAEILRCTHFTIRRRIADGSLPGYRFGPKILRVRRSDVLAMVRRIPTAGAR